jgi:hypothetical protein
MIMGCASANARSPNQYVCFTPKRSRVELASAMARNWCQGEGGKLIHRLPVEHVPRVVEMD